MKKLSVGLLLSILLLFPACEGELSFTDVSTLISITKNLVELSKEFGQGTEEIKTNIVNSTTAAAERIGAASDAQEMVSATQALSEQWTDINSGYVRLQQTLNRINDSATYYFSKLSANNNTIKKPDLKAKDMQQTAELHTRWQAQYQIAVDDMRAVDSLISQGNDFKVMLTDAVARSQVNNFLDSLKYISSEARRLAGEIKDFSRNVADLFQVANVPTYDGLAPAAADGPAVEDAPATRVDTSAPIHTVEAPSLPNPEPQADPAHAVESPTASCQRIWLEHNLFNNGLKGLKVHGVLLFDNCKEEDCSCAAVLLSESGEVPITDAPLQVSLRPGYDKTQFNDIKIFIPYSLLSQEKGEHNYKVLLNLYNNARQNTPLKIGSSESAEFTYTVN